MAELAVRVVIEGRVQGVGFRYWTEREAMLRGLSGWVRNRADGTVEALFAGPEAAVREMIEACREGPPAAYVTGVREGAAEMPAEAGFRHVR
jgi:acylphosphatase